MNPRTPAGRWHRLLKLKRKKINYFKIITGFFSLFLATKVAIWFVYYSPKTIKCTQKPKIKKKFQGIDQSSERASAILHMINIWWHPLLIKKKSNLLREDVSIYRTNLKYCGKSPEIRFISYFRICSQICRNNCGVVFLRKNILVFEKWFFRSTAKICKFSPWILPELCDFM